MVKGSARWGDTWEPQNPHGAGCAVGHPSLEGGGWLSWVVALVVAPGCCSSGGRRGQAVGTLGASAAAARPQKMALPAWPGGSRLEKGDALPRDLRATFTAAIPRKSLSWELRTPKGMGSGQTGTGCLVKSLSQSRFLPPQLPFPLLAAAGGQWNPRGDGNWGIPWPSPTPTTFLNSGLHLSTS